MVIATRAFERWCRPPRYFFDDPRAVDVTAPFAHVPIPIAAAVEAGHQVTGSSA